MKIPQKLIDKNPGLGEWSILVGYRGSIAHGMYVPNTDQNSIDDKDVMAVCVPPFEYCVGIKAFGNQGTQEIFSGEWDIVVYDAVKFIRLLQQGNPNVLCMLWLEPNYYMKVTPPGQLILDNRELFIGRHVYGAFVGYSYSQFRRMKRGEFYGNMGAKRKALAEKYGYDPKAAAHLIRLLRMGTEFLKDGRLNVLRHDANQLLEIKRGEWTLDQVTAEAERWFGLIDDAYVQSSLPAEPDMLKILQLSADVVRIALWGEDSSCGTGFK